MHTTVQKQRTQTGTARFPRTQFVFQTGQTIDSLFDSDLLCGKCSDFSQFIRNWIGQQSK